MCESSLTLLFVFCCSFLIEKDKIKILLLGHSSRHGRLPRKKKVAVKTVMSAHCKKPTALHNLFLLQKTGQIVLIFQHNIIKIFGKITNNFPTE